MKLWHRQGEGTARRAARGRAAGTARGAEAAADRRRSAAREPGDASPSIDLRDGLSWADRIQMDPAQVADLVERMRSRSARLEAQRELLRLRQRHWSGERVLEEGRTTVEWWEHPDADPYAVLGLLPGASMEEAATARRGIAARCHPDRLRTASEEDGDAALRRMIAANAAYDRLRRALNPV